MNIEQPTVTMVATDLDGTLLDSHKQVSEETRKVLRELKNRGSSSALLPGVRWNPARCWCMTGDWKTIFPS